MRSAPRSGARITVVTAGHVSACPRMLKAADALSAAGHTVRVVSTKSTPWATATDAGIRQTRTWEWAVVDYDRTTGRSLQVKSGARFHAMQALARTLGPSRAPFGVVARAYSRLHDELAREIAARPADLVYGGTTGALAAIAEAASRLNVPYGIDFEDFHSGEHGGPDGDVTNALAARVERRVIHGAAFVTAGSPMIADTYRDKYGIRPRPIHNTFTIAAEPTHAPADGPLRLYWFSQTLGPGRGLEHVVRAAGDAAVPIELHLRATPLPAYLASLEALANDVAPRVRVIVHDPLPPDAMVVAAQPYDAGLACEESFVLNRRLCLTNKVFTYLAAGVPVILSRTPAQACMERDLGGAAFGYACGDAAGLADIFRELATDRALRCRARVAAKAAAARRWHWEHRDDRGALIEAVEAAL